jgi:hypothetical protein
MADSSITPETSVPVIIIFLVLPVEDKSIISEMGSRNRDAASMHIPN